MQKFANLSLFGFIFLLSCAPAHPDSSGSQLRDVATNPTPEDPTDIEKETFVWWVSADKKTIHRSLCDAFRRRNKNHEDCAGDDLAAYRKQSKQASYEEFKKKLMAENMDAIKDVQEILAELEKSDLFVDYRLNDASGDNIGFRSNATGDKRYIIKSMDAIFSGIQPATTPPSTQP